jgi:hypothetical protein
MSGDIIGSQNHGPLFDAPPTVTATVSGGSALARARVAPKAGTQRGRVYAVIQAHGPVTRNAIAEILAGTPEAPATVANGVNARCAELLAAKLIRITGYETDSGRGLLAVATPETPTED